MIFHYAGNYNGDESKLPHREHPANSYPFKEMGMKELGIAANIGCLLTMIVLAIPFIVLGKGHFADNMIWLGVGSICAVLSLFPHELLHALCYKEDVYLYNNLSQGLLFVVGTEDMSKGRFIFTCLCPNLFLGIIPFTVFLIFPHLVGAGIFGLIGVGMGFGDYINIYNTVRQVPRGAKTYLSGVHSYWYLKE